MTKAPFHMVYKPFLNANYIFPTQQKDVYYLLQHLNPAVTKMVIFGSSVLPSCNIWSDIDVYVEVPEGINPFTERLTENPIDLWTSADVDTDLLNEIKTKGVIVYERE